LLNRNDEALKCYNTALAINPQNIDALENKGAYLLELHRDQESMECFDKALTIAERSVCSYFNKGMAFKRKGEFWDALSSFDKGLELCPNDEDALQCVDEILNKLIKTKKRK
jgi:tetratricopeptide (TPR) repeat protein